MFAAWFNVFSLVAFSSTGANGSASKVQQFLPENDLWREDSLTTEASTGISEQEFNEIIHYGLQAYQSVASSHKESLIINSLWSDSTVNARMHRSITGTVTVQMYGGLARRPEISKEGFVIVLCHELGHAYGGRPYLDSTRNLSAEGQSDYFSASVCAKEILVKLESMATDTTAYMDKACESAYSGNLAAQKICRRSLAGGSSLGKLISASSGKATPDYETPDTTVVQETQLSYPPTPQCRLDTFHNGSLNLPRPACWFATEQPE